MVNPLLGTVSYRVSNMEGWVREDGANSDPGILRLYPPEQEDGGTPIH